MKKLSLLTVPIDPVGVVIIGGTIGLTSAVINVLSAVIIVLSAVIVERAYTKILNALTSSEYPLLTLSVNG